MCMLYNYDIPVVPKTKHKHNVNQKLVASMVLFDGVEMTATINYVLLLFIY